jgi:hypothetical protein
MMSVVNNLELLQAREKQAASHQLLTRSLRHHGHADCSRNLDREPRAWYLGSDFAVDWVNLIRRSIENVAVGFYKSNYKFKIFVSLFDRLHSLDAVGVAAEKTDPGLYLRIVYIVFLHFVCDIRKGHSDVDSLGDKIQVRHARSYQKLPA